ncbi:hypothetical protein NC651_034317 [Populus alba x Populus x berolinensis]|nr:hypothetical protein NC651_034317 [Populus alba x Populus x berolinensis]
MNNLTHLDTLEIRSNRLSGHLPRDVCLGGLLRFFSARHNYFTGPIPKSLRNCSSLLRLRLERNQLSGNISEAFGTHPHLNYMDLSDNELHGELSLKWEQFNNLTTFKISGEMPAALGKATHLQALDLSSNQLVGRIPKELGNLKLIELALSDNILSGDIPFDVASLSDLERLGLAANNFSGSIPAEMGSLQSLESLDLSWNSLMGGIAPELGQLQRLEVLNLSHNMFLTKVDVSYNKLEGPIPDIKAFREAPFEAIRNNTNLCGNATGLEACDALMKNKTVPKGHRNIVKLYGFCSHAKHSFLVYEFVERGSLRKVLNDEEQAGKMDWDKRMNLIKGVANALSYMHHDCSPPIIHRDISSNNVLLDSEYEAHVSDFGTARLLMPDSSNWTSFAGTFGYTAPGM